MITVRTAPTVSPFTARMRHPVIWLPATWDELSADLDAIAKLIADAKKGRR